MMEGGMVDLMGKGMDNSVEVKTKTLIRQGWNYGERAMPCQQSALSMHHSSSPGLQHSIGDWRRL